MDILTYINRMNQIYGNGPAPAPRYNTQQYLQGGRVGYQGGQLVDHGPGRQGYNGKETRAETQARYAKKHGTSKIRQLADGTWVWHSTRGPLYAPTKTALKKKMASPKADWMAGILRRQKANTAALNLARDNVDQWTKDWFTKNLNEYGIRDLDKSLNQLTKDWKVEVKANPSKYTHSNFTGTAETGFPKIRGATKVQGTGKAKKIVPNPKAFKFPGVGSLGEGRGGDKYHRPFFKKVFYANYLNNNPTFKTDVKNYMEYILENKSGTVNQHNAKAFREFGEKIAKPDVIHFLSPDAGINTVSRSKLLGTAFPGLYQKFQNKVNSASIRYTENLKKVERKLKMPIGSIKKSMVAEQEALAKIFDVSELPQSLRYSADHQFGIAEAAKSKDLKFVQATVDNLRGMTVAMNEGLGWGGFSLQRKALTNEINAGRQVTENLEKLNKITKTAYNVDGAYQLSPKNKVIPAAHFVGESQPERFASYFKEISKTKEGSAVIKKQYGNLNNLIEELGCGLKKAAGGRVGFADGKNCLKKGQKKMNELLIKGTGTQAERGMIAKIVQGGSNLMKGLSPKEMLKIRNLIGPAALAFEAGIGAGMIGYDTLVKGTPIKQALGNNWLTSWAMPKSGTEYMHEDMNLSSPGAKTWGKGLDLQSEYDRLTKQLALLEGDPSAHQGLLDPKTEIPKVKKRMNEIVIEFNKVTRDGAAMQEGTGAHEEYMKEITEYQAKMMTRDKIEDDVGLKPQKSYSRFGPRGMGIKDETANIPIDQKRFNLPENYSTFKPNLPTQDRILDISKEENIGLTPEDANEFINQQKWKQLFEQPGIRGTQDWRGAKGGKVEYDNSLPDIFEEDK